MGKVVKFKFEIEGTGKLWRVKFYPEKKQEDPISLRVSPNNKKFYNNDFLVEVENPFEYELTVTGPQSTKWSGSLKIISADGEEKDFIKWNGKTGDGDGENPIDEKSIRTKPIKEIKDEENNSNNVILASFQS